ncbi:PAS domain S-box protein [Polaribacter ponticola]|uniref:histidine kinase n=1 Tax=Polaribacter ponticola TaxID=2978475 RepID=A0ABT5SE67_9FLAO|nr:PAS domain S-box protein [Polaribacter sp. MSW5]MDD7915736.1 PAS domain S-box protein [Polaribacter sp. MSW5]
MALSTALRKAEKESVKVTYKDIIFRGKDDKIKNLTLVVKPIKTLTTNLYNIFLIIFLIDRNESNINLNSNINTISELNTNIAEIDRERINLLEQELSDTKSNLQEMVEEVETSNEELQATNEELLASNEELQSTNEELQSVNEELHTVNVEYQEKIEEVASVNSYLENLIDSTEIGTIFLDKNLHIRKFTPSVKKFFNIIESDVGRSISHFNITFGEEKDKSFLDTLNTVLETGNSFEKEILHGEDTWYLKRLNPFIDSNKNIDGVVISFVDITPLKLLELEMDNKNIFLQKVIDVMPNILYIFNQETQSNEFVNKDIFKYLEYTKEEILAFKENLMPSLLHPEDFKKMIIHFKNLSKSKENEVLEFEYRIKHKNGEYRWFLSQDTLFQKIEGTNKIKHIGVATDITQLKESQVILENKVLERTKELKVAEKKYHKLYDSAPDMFASVNPKNGKIIECNQTLLNKIGFSRNEVIGMHIIDLYHKDYKQDAKEAFNTFVKTGKVTNKELKINKKDSGAIDVNLNVSSVKDKNGNILYNTSSWRDITDIKNVLSELEELTYVSTHDIKAPINNISSFISLLKEDNTIKNSNSVEAINWIEKNIKNANSTLENLISVAKARTLVLDNFKKIDIESSYKLILPILKDKFKIDEIEISADFKACKTVVFSEPYVNSMLQNVLNNAIKYRSLDRNLKIEVKSFSTKNFDCISISDNGIGIDLKEHENHVFGLFKRASDVKEGSGLALYLIKKILEKTGGKIEVESKLGEGSTFTLYFNNKN